MGDWLVFHDASKVLLLPPSVRSFSLFFSMSWDVSTLCASACLLLVAWKGGAGMGMGRAGGVEGGGCGAGG
eukprot:COSAG02_NODE_22506_length_750_cov_1.066052_1_plen_70_part_10